MANLYDKVKKKAINKAYQNRFNRATKKAKEYNNGKFNKTQQNYVKGDIKSSSSTRAYGYKTHGTMKEDYFQTSFTGGRNKSRYAKQQKGENPYELKYVYTGKPTKVQGGTRADGTKYGSYTTKKRRLTDKEKEVYKATGGLDVKSYDEKNKYNIMSSSNKDAKTFIEHSNVFDTDGKFKWDGMQVAKNRVNNGKSKWNYVGGFLKDTVVDPVVRGLQYVDMLTSAGMGGFMGAVEESANAFEAIADEKKTLKDNVNLGRIVDNFKSSIESSNKTGWGKSVGEFFDEMTIRNNAKERQRILESDQYTEEHKKKLLANLDEVENSGKHKAFRSIAGLGMDAATPVDLGAGAVKGVKNAVKSLTKGDNVVNFVPKASQELIETGRKHQDMLERMKAYKNYLQEEYIPKFGKNIDEAKALKGFEDSRFAEEYAQKIGYEANGIDQGINRMLDNGFNRAMVNDTTVKEVTNIVKSNPQTQNLGRFLDEIGTNVDKGVQRHIDGRKLNAKRTQVKDGYVPQMLRNTDEIVENVDKVDSNQLSFDNLSRIKNEYENIYNSNELDDVFEYIDELDDVEADNMLDWLKNRDPLAYEKYMSGADTIDDFADTGINVNKIKSKAYDKQIKEITNIKPKNNIKFDVAKTDAMKEENAIERLAKLFSDETIPKTYKNSIERNDAFREYIGQFSDDLFNGKVDIDNLSNTIKQIRGKDVPAKVKREFVNNKLFGGNNVISSSVSNSSIDAFLESLEDISNLKRVAKEYMKTGEILPVQLSSATKKFLNIGDDLKIKGGKVRSDKIDSPEDLLRTLTNSIYDRSRALTDDRYGEKLQLMAKNFGYEDYYHDVVNKLDDLTSELKSLDKLPVTKENLSRKLELSENIKRLKQIKTDRTKMWESIKNLPESNFDKYISEVYPQHMKGMNVYSPRANQTKELEYLSKDSTINKGFNEALEKNLSEGDGAKQSKYIDDLESIRSDRRSIDITKDDETFNESKLLKSVGLEPVINIPNLAKNYKPTYSHLKKMPGAKHVISNVKKLLTKIVDYDTPVVRKIDGKMQIAPYEFESKTLRKELNKQIEIMRKAGIKDYMWFEEIKKFKADLIKNTERGKLDFNELKGVSVNKGKKIPDDVRIERDMNNKAKELFIQDEYERILNASNPEELFMSVDYDKYTPSHGDNIGVKLSDKSEHKNLVQFDELVKADVDSLSKTVGDTKNVSWSPLDKLSESFKGQDKHIKYALKKYEDLSTESILDRLSRSDVDPESRDMLSLYAQLEKRGVDFSKAFEENTKNFKKAPSTLQMYAEHYEKIDPKFVNPLKSNKTPLDKIVDDIDMDAENPFSSIKDGVDEILDEGVVEKKVRRKKTQEEIDQINATLERYNNQTPLDKIVPFDKKRLPRISELMEQGMIKEEAIKLIEKMKKGEIDIPSADVVTKPDRLGGVNTTTKANVNELRKVISDIGYGVSKESQLKPGEFINKSTGEIEDMKKYRLDGGNVKNSNPNVYNNVDDVVEQMNQLEHFENFLSGKSSETLVDTLEGVGANIEPPAKAPSKEIQKLMDYVEEEMMFDGFNESIGNDVPSFEKFKRWFNDGSKVAYNDNKAYDLYKRWLNSWKKGLTIYNPGWHVKNFFQNKGQSYLDIGMDAFGSQKNAREMFKNMKGLENSAKGILQKNGTYYSPSELTNIAKRSGVINGFNDLVKESRGLIPPLETAVDNSKLMKKLSMSEEAARLHHFLTKIEKGATPEEAVKSVNKYLFDYSKQNKFDRVMGDFIDPFWTYHKNNARLMTAQGIENADKVANTYRGLRGMQDDVQDEDKASVMYRDIQSPVGSFVDSKNKDRYNYQYNLDLFPMVDGAVPIEKDDIMSKLNPILKIAYQQSQGLGNFDNKIVDKEVADWGEVTKKERNEEMFSEVNPFMNPLIKAIKKSKDHDSKAKEGKQSQETSNKQILMDWLEYIFGNKGNYYRDVR